MNDQTRIAEYRPRPVLAVKYDGTNEDAVESVVGAAGGHINSGGMGLVLFIKARPVVDRPVPTLEAKKGEFVVFDPSTGIRVLTPEEFRAAYEFTRTR